MCDKPIVDPKRTGVKAVMIPEFKFHANPGDCMHIQEADQLSFACPGCGQWGCIRIGHPKPTESPSWDIVSGTPEYAATLTVQPSIHCVGCCGWHGYLQNGIFVSC